jgi:hypothetical protein
VSATADPGRRGAPFTMALGDNWVIYENRECGPFDVPVQCLDLNGDNDQDDYFVEALDLTTAGATPTVIDEIDGKNFAGYPGNFPFNVYAIESTDKLVSFRIPEKQNGLFVVDLDLDGTLGEVHRWGAYDLTRGQRVLLADDAPRISIADNLLLFAVEQPGQDILHLYDTDEAVPGPYVVNFNSPMSGLVPLPVTRATFPEALYGKNYYPPYDIDLTTAQARFAVTVDEAALSEELNGQPGFGGQLIFFTYAFPNLSQATLVGVDSLLNPGMIASDRWLEYRVVDNTGAYVHAIEWNPLSPQAVPLCTSLSDSAGDIVAVSDSLIACAIYETAFLLGQTRSEDLNGDGDMLDVVLHVYLPDDPGGPMQVNLGLVANSNRWWPFAIGDVLIFGVDEAAQGADLNDDGDGSAGCPSLVSRA